MGGDLAFALLGLLVARRGPEAQKRVPNAQGSLRTDCHSGTRAGSGRRGSDTGGEGLEGRWGQLATLGSGASKEQPHRITVRARARQQGEE